MRYLLALLLLSLLPLTAPQAAISVTGTVSCADANSISYGLGDTVFRFSCASDGLNYNCTPTQVVVYDVAASSISLTCNNVVSQGLIVDAIVDGVQNGNGNADGVCNNANNFSLDLGQGKYTWICGQKSMGCFAVTDSTYSVSQTKFTMNCTTVDPRIYRNGFEDTAGAL